MSNRPEDLEFADAELSLDVFRDGTITKAEISFEDVVIGQGIARRRKGDPRNPELGDRLAIARAFSAASSLYYGLAGEMGHDLLDELIGNLKRIASVVEASKA
jgi:hypothetical protein